MTKEKKEIVSIIVPAYNAEDTLEKCLQSIANQTYPFFEAIVVNDGSTDDTQTIAERWSQKDDRIRVVRKENGGVSAARNAALADAQGEWVTFLDSDDYLEPDYLERLLDGEAGDMAVIGYHTVGAHEIREENYVDTFAKEADHIKKVLENHLTDMTFLCPWGKLFKASLIRRLGLKFDTDMRIGEDVVFVWTYLAHCSSIALKSGQCYNYYTGPSDFKYALDAKAAMDTILRIFVPLDTLEKKTGMNTEKARNHILNYYIWLYKLYVKRFYGKKDVPQMVSFFQQPLISDYFRRNKWKSKDKLIVFMLLRLHLTVLLYKLIKLYY